MANLFSKAKSVETQPKAARASKKDEIYLAGLKELAELDTLVKSATAIMKTVANEVKANALSIFIEKGTEAKKKPDSFRGKDGDASASVECRKRGTNSPLSDAEVELLERLGIKAHRQVSVQKLFGINPKYAEDEKMLEKISAALENAGVPDDLIVVQEEVAKYVVDDKAVEQAFAMGEAEAIETVITMAIKPKLDNVNLAQIMDDLKSIVVDHAASQKED